MNGETRAAGDDGLVIAAGAPVFLSELRKRNRRRILLDPASKLLNSRIVGHGSMYHVRQKPLLTATR